MWKRGSSKASRVATELRECNACAACRLCARGMDATVRVGMTDRYDDDEYERPLPAWRQALRDERTAFAPYVNSYAQQMRERMKLLQGGKQNGNRSDGNK